MIVVVQSFHVLCLLGVLLTAASRQEVLHPGGINAVVIIRVVLEGVDFVSKAVLEMLSEVNVRFVGVELTIDVRGIEMPAACVLLGHHIDDATNGISTELYWHHTTVHLNMVGKGNRYVVETE